ncbi:MAG: PDZ domain-containing protein, partial [Halobacteriovoraceae bacterium]|nr:PDZ domain-containing protein [Halobacteriovoraceae bacterium]
DEDDYNVDEGTSISVTNPSLTEFDIPPVKKSFKTKISDAISNLKSSFKDKGKPSFQMKAGESKLLAKLSSINFDEYFNSFFSPQNRPKAHRIYLTVFFILGSYITGRLISGFLTPTPSGKVASTKASLSLDKSDRMRKNLADLRNNDLFQAPEESTTPVIGKRPKQKSNYKEPKTCKEASKKSSLGIKLVNTVILQDSVKSLASVQLRGKEDYLREGDAIPNMIEVGKIVRKKLIFKNLKNRQCEYIENTEKVKGPRKPIKIVTEPKKAKQILKDAKVTGISQSGNQFKIKKEVRQRMLENISEVLTQARAIQIKNPDGSLAFRMQEIVPGSIYSQLNIQEGDMITGINGKKITNMAELMNLFGQIDKIDHFELSLSRDGVEQNLEYDFE